MVKEFLSNFLVIQKWILKLDIILWPVKLININLRQPEARDRAIKYTFIHCWREHILVQIFWKLNRLYIYQESLLIFINSGPVIPLLGVILM